MDCIKTLIDEHGSFINKYTNHDSDILKYYEYDPNAQSSFERRHSMPSNGREKVLADVIKSYMSDLDLSTEQEENLRKLADGNKVVIGGQQAGLFTGPLYTFHKIISIIILAKEQSKALEHSIIPVFWIAGEDHDFDEVNHTFAYDRVSRKLEKIKYHTNVPPEKSISQYQFDEDALIDNLNEMFNYIGETKDTKEIKNMVMASISHATSWSDVFKHMTHRVFKDYGLLLIDANDSKLRTLEKQFFHQILKNHQKLDDAFRKTQSKFSDIIDKKMILTDSNVHLFYEYNDKRQLIMANEEYFYLNKDKEIKFSKSGIMDEINQYPERFSNNVVTRPVMQEYLFNTLSFIGGPSEIIYWGELKGVFDLLNIEMPIVMPRMRISYLTEESKKHLNKYDVDLDDALKNGIDQHKKKFIRAQASQEAIDEIEQMKRIQKEFYEKMLREIGDDYQNEQLLEKNNQIHAHQYEYLMNRYLLNIERENEISMRHFDILQNTLHPHGGLQERVWNPIQVMNYFGKSMFSPSTYPPLRYTFEHITLEI